MPVLATVTRTTGRAPSVERNAPSRAPVFTGFHQSVRERLVVGPHFRNKATMTVAVEQYRKLAAALEHLRSDRRISAVMTSSPGPGEGKTLTAVNLALTFGELSERRVLLIDADLARPTLHKLFQVPNLPGLGENLQEDSEPRISPLKIARNLALMTAGIARPDWHDALTSPRMWRIIQEASARWEWVLVDAPPVTLLPDARVLANLLDGVLMVVSAGKTDRATAESAVRAIPRNRLLGVVLNRVPPPEISRL